MISIADIRIDITKSALMDIMNTIDKLSKEPKLDNLNSSFIRNYIFPKDIRLDGFEFSNVKFYNCFMENISMIGCKFRNVSISHCDMNTANLRTSVLENVDIFETNLKFSLFMNSRIEKTNISLSCLNSSNFDGSEINNSKSYNSEFEMTSFRNLRFNQFTFYNSDLKYSDFTSAKFNKMDFLKSELINANFSRSTGLLDPIEYIKENFEHIDEGIIVYKIFSGYREKNPEWIFEPGSIIKEEINYDRTLLRASGINVMTLDRSRSQSYPFWKSLIRYEWFPGIVVPYSTSGEIRTARLQLIEKI